MTLVDQCDANFTENDGAQNLNPSGLSFVRLIKEDFRTHEGKLGAQGFWVLFWHLFGNWRMDVKPRVLRLPLTLIYRLMFKLSDMLCRISLPYTARVGRRVKLKHFGGMVLVAHTIGDDVTIRQNTTFDIPGLGDRTGRPIIGDAVELGAGAVIVGRVLVGDGAIVGANAVVTKDVPPGAVLGGVPARMIKPSQPSE